MKSVKDIFKASLSLLYRCVLFFSQMIEKIFPSAASFWNQLEIGHTEAKKSEVIHDLNGTSVKLVFYTPNALTKYRADTFSTKEPETLEWINKYGIKGGIFFDIGANVGLYSIYNAKTMGGITYSFEPSVFNLKLLVKNINVNNCQKNIRIITNPLTSANSFADFNLQSTVDGGALSSFGVDYGHDGTKLNTQVSYQTLGFSLDYLVEQKIIADIPTIIKIDVDGIEHLILKGAVKVLSDPKCRSVLIEVNDTFIELASDVDSILKAAGFTLLEKRSVEAEFLEQGTNFTHNQIWIK